MRLFLMRHANTELIAGKEDFERELTLKGREEAAEGAKFLADYQIDKIIVSYVKRTIETADIILDRVAIKEKEVVTELYKSDEYKVINLIENQSASLKNILVIGHNPTIFKVATLLIDQGGHLYDTLMSTSMPTGRIIVIDFNINSWDQISYKKGKVIQIFTPAQ